MAYEIAGETPEEFGLREFVLTLRRRKMYVIVATAITLATAGIYVARQTPVYRSTGQVLVLNPSLNPVGQAADINMETEATLATSPEVARQAAKVLGTSTDPGTLLEGLTVDVNGETEILIFVYSDPVPRLAQARVGAFVEGYLRFRRDRYIDQSLAASAAIQSRIEGAQQQLTRINAKLADAPTAAIREQLQARANTLSGQIILLQQQEFQTISSPEVGRIIQFGSAPSASDTSVRSIVLALFVGLSVGAGIALLAERFDDRLRGRNDLARRASAPVLAAIPRLPGREKADVPVLATERAPDSATSEAYRTLRTAMLFVATEGRIKTLLVTSPQAGEGKTTMVANLAVVLGKAGKRVIVVVADLRRPRLERFFAMPNGSSGPDGSRPGLTNVLAAEVSVDDALAGVPGSANVRILPSGPTVGNPAELLGSAAMVRIITQLRDRADFVLIDGAPVLGLSDALVLSRFADGTLLVADAARTRRTTVTQARMQLRQVDAKLIGSVLVNVDARVDGFSAEYGAAMSSEGQPTR